jgi:hypothetical protein
MPARVVIYIRGRDSEVAEQLAHCEELRQQRRYTVVGIARDAPGQTSAWDDANAMVKRGQADRIIMASAGVVPEYLESATGALPGPGIPRRVPGAHRRIRPLRRHDRDEEA